MSEPIPSLPESTAKYRDHGLWEHADFLKLWAGQTVSVFGSLLSRIAIPFAAALTLHATPAQMALLGVADVIPSLVVGPFAGVWADRARRRPLMITADLLRAAVLVAIPIVAWRGLLRIEHLYLAGLLTGMLNAVFDVAYGAYLPTLVGVDRLAEGNAKLSATASVAEFTAFSIAGWLVQWFGGPIAIGIDALTFLVSAGSLIAIRRGEPGRDRSAAAAGPPSPATGRHLQQILREIADGLRLVVHDPILLPLATANALLSFSAAVFGTLIILFITQTLHVPTGIQGMIFSVGGVTSLLGALAAERVACRTGVGNTLALALVVAAIGGAFVPLAPDATLAGIALLILNQLVSDPAFTIFEIHQSSLRQTRVDDTVRGRAEATFRFAGTAARLAGLCAAAVLGEHLGLRTTMLLGCAGIALAGVLLALSPVRQLRTIAVD